MDKLEPTGGNTFTGQSVRWIRKHWGLIVAVVVPVVTVATMVLPLIADANVRSTSARSLEVGVAQDERPSPTASTPGVGTADTLGVPATAAVGLASVETVGSETYSPNQSWRVRSDAPFTTFPLDEAADGNACNAAQITWLEQWGRREAVQVWNGYLTLSNTATDGSSLSVRNIHSVGKFTTPEVPEVAVMCVGGMGSYSELVYLRQELGSANPAVLDAAYNGLPPGSPAVLNIAPGQFVQTWVDFVSPTDGVASDFAGSLVADVEVGSTSTEVVLFDGFTRIAPPEITTTTLRITGTEVSCGPGGGWDTCTVDQFISQMQADPGYHR